MGKAEERERVVEIRRRLSESGLIGRAVGVLMYRTGCTRDAALAELTRGAALSGRTPAEQSAVVLAAVADVRPTAASQTDEAPGTPQQPPDLGMPTCFQLVTTDPDRACGELSRAYGTEVRIAARPPAGPFQIDHVDAGTFRSAELGLPGTLGFTSEAVPQLVVVELLEGRAERWSADVEDRLSAGDVFLGGHPATNHHGRTLDARVRSFVLPLPLVYRVSGRHPDQRGPLGFTSLRAASPAWARHWRATAAYVADVLGSPDVATPLVTANAAQLLAAAALSVFPNSTRTTPADRSDSGDATSATLRRALHYIQDNAHRDVALADIAEAAHVTPRALQYAFRSHLETTPLGYLRDVRLRHAHGELLNAAPDSATVTQIAAHWGFLHPGRFAALYQQAYHCPPSTTLRN